jgi:Domain of unknown function (DUF5919)
MARYRAADHLPPEILARPDFADACAGRDLGAMFRIAMKYGPDFTPSHIARRCEMTVSKIQDYARGRTLAQSIAIFERVSDGLRVPGRMLGISPRPWEDGSAGQLHGIPRDAQIVAAAYEGRGLIARQQWNQLIEAAGECIWLYGLAEFGYATDDDVPLILAAAAANGCEIRILLLDPEYPGTRQIDEDEGSPPGTLSTRIKASLARFLKMREACGERMAVRVYSAHPTASVIRGDDRMVVTPYLRFFTGSNSPTFELQSGSAGKIFGRYARHVEETWERSKEWDR